MERPGGCDQYLSCGDIFEVSFCNAVEGKEKDEVYDGSEDEAEDSHGHAAHFFGEELVYQEDNHA